MQSDNGHLSALSSKEFERILLIKPSAVGDVIHTLPVLVKLRAAVILGHASIGC